MPKRKIAFMPRATKARKPTGKHTVTRTTKLGLKPSSGFAKGGLSRPMKKNRGMKMSGGFKKF